MLEYLEKVNALTKGAPFMLQEVIKGTEVSVEGYFNGDDFYLINVTLEEKKFMNKSKGPNTGCAGNLVFPLSNQSKLFKQGLGKLRNYLHSIQYTGMIDLNTIANNEGLFGLEWTPRFGYDASAALMVMYGGNFGEMLLSTATGQVPDQTWKYDFVAGVRLSIPPYPSEFKGKHPQGVPVKGIEPEDLDQCYVYDVELEKGGLVTAGHSGFIAVPMAGGRSIYEAFAGVDSRVDSIRIPNMQIRTDIRDCVSKRYNELQDMGLLV
jgi:phosphoribosylamine--glycine ligase